MSNSPSSSPAHVQATRSAATELEAALLAGVARLISGVQVRWLDCAPEPRRRVYFANHTSHLDAVVLWGALPAALRARTRPVAARDYWAGGALRRHVAERLFRAVLIERPSHAAEGRLEAARRTVEQLVEALQGGDSLIVFPEGTRGAGEEVAAFKSGLFHLVQRVPEAELVPAYLENLNRILPKGEVLPVPLLSSLTFGAPLRLEPGEEKQAFLRRTRDALCALRPR